MKRAQTFLIAIGIGLFLPLVSFAAAPAIFPTGFWGPLIGCKGRGCDLCGLLGTAQNVIYFGLTLLIYVIVPLMVMAGGFVRMISQGSPEKVSQSNAYFKGAAIGLALGLSAYLIVDVVYSTVFSSVNVPGQTEGWSVLKCNIPEYLKVPSTSSGGSH
jgi:hypothetical protein